MSKETQLRAIVEEANLIYGYTQEEIAEMRAQVRKRRQELFPQLARTDLVKGESDGKGKSGSSSAS